MEELIGFVASNNRLGKILAVLDSKGPMDSATIAKTTRIAGVEKNIEMLAGKELVSFENGRYSLTELGAKVSHKVKGIK
ncbi:MAG: transcriptional regulator [Candidatus Methanoperedenaceae archaeon]|nr:transcriptional regulator [Candidatus Methanoperedenaceae archaeon]MDW7725772.1 transcriptional regulator [Candidatus Methanoperedens sp.]